MSTPAPDPKPPQDRVATALGWAAVCALVWPIALRVTTINEPMPYWLVDPWRAFGPPVGLTPTMAFACDATLFVALALASAWAWRAHRRVSWVPLALGVPGWGIVAWHVVRSPDVLEQARIGSAWGAAIACGLAAWVLSREARWRTVLAGLGIGLIMLVAAKGVEQIYVEHPATLESYEANPDKVLMAQGWAPGSAQALAYERRLRDPVATGWVGLSNVTASFAAVGLIVLAASAWYARTHRLRALGFAGGALASGVLLALTGSKGGYAVAAMGLAIAAAAPVVRRLGAHAGGLVALGAAGLVLAAIVTRAILGPDLSERSVLFRWYYVSAATRIAADHPLLGVGQDGFKDAYLVAKNPLSPEEVSSPHSVLFEWWATLGVGGLAWGTLLIAALWRTGRALAIPDARAGKLPVGPGVDWRSLLLVAAVPVVIGAVLEMPMGTIEAALMRLVGFAAWVAAAALCARGVSLIALSAGAIALVAHGQLEMTLTNPQAAGWAALLVGVACAGGMTVMKPMAQSPWASTVAKCGTLAGVTGAAVIVVVLLAPTLRWELAIDRAAAPIDAVLADESLDNRTELFARQRASDAAAWQLDRALEVYPDHFGTLRATARLQLERAALLGSTGESPDDALDRAEQIAGQTLDRLGTTAKAWAWGGSVAEAIAQLGGGREVWLGVAVERWERAAELDPHGLIHAVRLSDAYSELHNEAAARAWAERAFVIDADLRLDPLKGLTDAERARLGSRLDR